MEVESGNVSNYDLPSVGILLPAYVKKKIVSEVLKYTIEKQFFFPINHVHWSVNYFSLASMCH